MALKKWKPEFHCGHTNWNAKTLEAICENLNLSATLLQGDITLLWGAWSNEKTPMRVLRGTFWFWIYFCRKEVLWLNLKYFGVVGCGVGLFGFAPLLSHFSQRAMRCSSKPNAEWHSLNQGTVTLPHHQLGHSLCRGERIEALHSWGPGSSGETCSGLCTPCAHRKPHAE